MPFILILIHLDNSTADSKPSHDKVRDLLYLDFIKLPWKADFGPSEQLFTLLYVATDWSRLHQIYQNFSFRFLIIKEQCTFEKIEHASFCSSWLTLFRRFIFPKRCIARRGFIGWPAESSDLTQFVFFSMGISEHRSVQNKTNPSRFKRSHHYRS